MSDLIEYLRGACERIEPVGSSVTCNPPPMDTDEDWLVYLPAGEYAMFEDLMIHVQGCEFGGSRIHAGGCLIGDPNSFQSYTLGHINVIATASQEFFDKFMEATAEAKRLNLLDKDDRIALFQKILYNVDVYGEEEGQRCRRDGCEGHIEMSKSENCSCHISPPCSSCTSTHLVCSDCDWEEPEEFLAPAPSVPNSGPVSYDWMMSRKISDLDRTRINWVNLPHSGCSMIKEGVFPIGTPSTEVEEKVKGTFGGRFQRFDKDAGTFKYIAYTD